MVRAYFGAKKMTLSERPHTHRDILKVDVAVHDFTVYMNPLAGDTLASITFTGPLKRVVRLSTPASVSSLDLYVEKMAE